MIEGIECHSHGIRGYGNPSSRVMIIGIAPGSNEMKQKRPFVGQSGKLLDAVLKSVGWPREKTYCTNLICWFNNDPDPTQIKACLPRLLQEIAEYKPKLVVTLGKTPSEFFGQGRQLSEIRGAVLWNELLGSYTMATYHPSAVLHGGSFFIHDIVRDLAKIPRVINEFPENGPEDIPYLVARNVEEAQIYLSSFMLNEHVAVDIETSNKETDIIDVYEDKLLCLAISNGMSTYVIPESCAQGLVWPKCTYIFHNGMFDSAGLKKYLNVDLPIHEDTMLMSYSLDERSGHHKLKTLAREYVGAGFYEEETKKYRKGKFDTVSPEKLYWYNARDAAYTARLYYVLRTMQDADNVRSIYERLLIPVANCFRDIQLRGVRIDQDRLRELALEWLPKYLESEEVLAQEAESYGFEGRLNPRSNKQLSKFLYGILLLPGGPSVDKKSLEALNGSHPFIQKLRDYRGLEHLVSHYVMGIQPDIKKDGRVHSNVLIHGTVTGRLSYTDPPLQTIPKADIVGKDFARIREIFSVSPGYVLVEADYERAEVWGAYAHSKDPMLLADLQQDFHRNVASAIYRKPPEEVTDLERKKSKYISFGVMYGRGAASLAAAEMQGYSIGECQTFIDNWNARYHVYRDWAKQIRTTAQTKGEVVSMIGRKRRFKLMLDNVYELLNEAINFPIQSLASDIVLDCLIELHTRLKEYDSYILIAVHDALVFEISEKYFSECISLIKEVMERPGHFIPEMPGIPVEIKVGKNWGKLSVLDIQRKASVSS